MQKHFSSSSLLTRHRCPASFTRHRNLLLLSCWVSASSALLAELQHCSLRIFARTTMTETKRFSSLLNNSDNDNPHDSDDTNKWERMYVKGLARRQSKVNTGQDDSGVPISSRATPVRVVSFDLDNCLWRTSTVINGANDALAKHLQQVEGNFTQNNIRTEIIMKELFDADQKAEKKYGPGKAPVQLTQLRKDAIQHILVKHCGYTDQVEAKVKADEYFDVWTTVRHAAIPQNLAKDAVKTLRRIRQTLSSSQTVPARKVIMGAITDGNSDPTRIKDLQPFFDFVVNAERVGVSKPDPAVYLQAMQQAVAMLKTENDDSGIYSIREDQVGPWWVHVGDDFVKDIVAAREMGMRTAWTREFVKQKSQKASQKKSSSNRSVQEFVQQVSSMKVVTMQVGAEDYLAESLQEEFADIVIDSFADLADVLKEWHEAGLAETGTRGTTDPIANTNTNLLELYHPDNEKVSGPSIDVDSKFCVHCGQRLPSAAKFCSSCGKPQPALN